MSPRSLTAIVAAALAAPAMAQTASINPAKDNTLYLSATGNVSNALGSHMFAGRNSAGNTRRALMQFDLEASIPAGATITGATLRVNVSSANAATLPFSLHRLTADWGEGTSQATGSEGSGAPSTPGDATWLHRSFNSVLWMNQGGDFNPLASATTSIGDIGFYEWSAGPAMLADLQSWLDNPAMNFGWIVLGGESGPSTAKRFDTKDNPNAAVRPVLTVQYVPTPGVMALVGMAGIGALRRRR